MKNILVGCIASLLFLSVGSVEAKVYKWVDKDGNVHFSDKPVDQAAKEVEVKEVQTTKTVKTKVKPITYNTNDRSRDYSDSSDSSSYSGVETCSYLRTQLKKAQKGVNSKKEIEASFARVYVKKVKERMSKKGC